MKCETASSGIAKFLDAYRDLLFGMRWLLVPAILVTMALVIANAISISVRERRTEMAVLKVLGFAPNQIMMLVLGEALLIGCCSGLVSAWLAKYLVNELIGGISLPIAFFGMFIVADAAPWWGLAIGAARPWSAASCRPGRPARSRCRKCFRRSRERPESAVQAVPDEEALCCCCSSPPAWWLVLAAGRVSGRSSCSICVLLVPAAVAGVGVAPRVPLGYNLRNLWCAGGSPC